MIDKETLIKKFSNIEKPHNYFIGEGKLSFPPPNNVLTFYRDTSKTNYLYGNFRSHSRYVCIFNLKDPITLLLDGFVQEINTNEGALILPYQHHKFIKSEKYKNIGVIFITFTMDTNSYFDIFKDNYFKVDQTLIQLLNRFQKHYNSDGFNSIPFVLGDILLYISKKKNIIENKNAIKAMENKLLQLIITTINNQMDITIIEIANKLGYSENYIRRYFKQNMDISLGKYINDMRMNKALSLLYTDKYSISEVAEKCKYDSLSSFSRTFKHLVGISPKAFRSVLQENPNKIKSIQYGNELLFFDKEDSHPIKLK